MFVDATMLVSSLTHRTLLEDNDGSDFDPTDTEHIRQTYGAAIASYVLGVLVAVAFILFFLVRWCCCCAGAGCCAKNKKPAAAMTVSCHIVLALVLVLLTAIGGGVMTASGRPVSDSIAGLSDTLIEQAEVFMGNLTDIVTIITDVKPDDATLDMGSLTEAEDNMDIARDTLADFKESSDSQKKTLRTLIRALGGFIIICAAFGLLTLASRRMWLLMIFLFLSLFGSVVGWGMGGTGLLMNSLFSDACTLMHGYINDKPNEWLDDQLSFCDDLEGARRGMYPAMEAANLAVEDANDQIRDVNLKASAYSTSTPTMCLPFLEQDGAWTRNNDPGSNCVVITEANVNQTYSPLRCPYDLPADTQPATNAEYQSCMQEGRPILPETYLELVDASQSLDKINSVLPQIQSLAECGFIEAAFAKIYANDCDDLQSSTETMAIGALIAAVSLTLASLLFCLCIRNIRKQPESDQMLYSTPQKGKYSQPGSPGASAPIGSWAPTPSAPPPPAQVMV